MSRIDEALRRTGGHVPARPEDSSTFRSAWTTAGGEEAAVDTMVPNGERQATEHLAGVNNHSLGMVTFSSVWREQLARGPDGDPVLIEQFRRLAATLHHAQQNNGLKTVMLTSAIPGDGKTLSAVNLALVLAESYRAEVLLIDADLRRPSIPSVVDLGEGAGLSEALRAPTEQKLALARIAPTLTLLPAGQPISNSIEALTSPRMRQILDEARQRFDWVILDAPPVGLTADARLLTQMVDGALFVIHAGRTQHRDVQKAIDALGREHIMGVVLNGVNVGASGGDYYYGPPTAGERGRAG